MRFGRLAAATCLLSLFPVVAGEPANAQSCLLGILCGPKSLPAPSPTAIPAPSTLETPAPGPVTQPVSGAVDSAQQAATGPAGVLEGQMLSLLNAERTAAGLRPLQMSAWAQSFARSFSERMMSAGAIWHNSDYFAKGRKAMGADLLSENVGYDSSIAANHLGFMRSPSHRNNILDPRFSHVGIGVAISQTGRVYVTEDFARIPGSGAAAPSQTASRGPQAAQDKTGDSTADGGTEGISPGSEQSEFITLPGRPGTPGDNVRPVLRSSGRLGTPQSPSPMIPGLVTGGLAGLMASLLVIGRKLLALLGM